MADEATPHPEFDQDALTAYRWIVEQGLLDPDHELGEDFIAAGRTPAVTSELLLNLYPYSESTIAVSGHDGDVVASVFTPHEPTDSLRAAIVWIHGGGMFGGDRFQAMEALILAEQQGMVVVSVEYRRAPENPYPAPGDDSLAVLRAVESRSESLGIDRHRLFLAGVSAGGGIAAATALRVRDEGGPELAGIVLLCPMLDDRMLLPSTMMSGLPVWNRAENEFGWRTLLGHRAGGDEVSPYAAPARATDLSGLASIYIDVGSADLFRDECVEFASRIWASGGAAELHVWPGGFHGSELMMPNSPLGEATWKARNDWLTRTIDQRT
jgi:acetyl esterase/lipase